MKRSVVTDGLIFALLVAFGVLARVWFRTLPNFAPVAALALFAGYTFRSRAFAALAPLSVMAISDLFLGGYVWQVRAMVYAMLVLPVLFGAALNHLHRKQTAAGRTQIFARLAGLIGCSLIGSLTFFLVTNFAHWLWFGGYENSLSGLLTCYARAIPFFRFTLAGDTFFASLFFSSYFVAQHFSAKEAKQEVVSVEV